MAVGYNPGPIAPTAFIIPIAPVTQISGAAVGDLCISGAKIYFWNGTKYEVVTSTAT